MSAADRESALLALVAAYRAARRDELLAPALEEARRLSSSARRTARQRVKIVIAAERSASAARIAAAEARLATKRRMARQHRLQALIEEAWKRLPGLLARRWTDADARGRWIEACLDRALDTLPHGAWTITGPHDWSETERAHARQRLAARGIEAAMITATDITAGLRVAHGGIVLDATLAGLTADRREIEGRLLHHLAGGTT